MHENEKLTDLIKDIYDTTLDPGLWTNTLANITDFLKGQACGIISKDPASKFGDTHYYCNVDPYYIQLYAKTYAKFDPMAALPRSGEVVSIPDLVSYDDYRQGRFYQEWLRPQGWADFANIVLEKSGPHSALLLAVIPKKAGMVDDDMRRRIALIAPHARRALLISRAMDNKKSEAATFADTLNGLSAAIFLVDADGRIVHANDAARDMLYANDFLRSIGGRLSAADAHINQALRDATARGNGTGIGAKAIVVPLIAHDGERYIAHVLPLTAGERLSTGLAHSATAAVFVRKAALGSPLDVIAPTYNLTPTELRVLSCIVDIGGVPETAKQMGVAETTVKTHLYRLFDKVGVSRQADLVKLVADFSNPLVDR